jgi:hypothetical protein
MTCSLSIELKKPDVKLRDGLFAINAGRVCGPVAVRVQMSGFKQHGDCCQRHRIFGFDLIGNVVLKEVAKTRVGTCSV